MNEITPSPDEGFVARIATIDVGSAQLPPFTDEARTERSNDSYSLRWIGRQITRLEAGLRKVDRQLEQHFRAVDASGEISAAMDLWAIRMLIRRIDIETQLRHWHEVSDQLIEGVPTYTSATIRRGDYVRISGHWRKVARVNQKSVTVETEYSRTGRAAYHDITDHRPADGPDAPLP